MITIECDRDFRSQLLLSWLKDYDRIISKQSFDLFDDIRIAFKRMRLKCITDETVHGIKPDHGYIKCTIITDDESTVDAWQIGFYQCNFIGAKKISSAFVFGENISIGRDLVWTDVHTPFGPFVIREIRSSELSEKLLSKNIAEELMTAFLLSEICELLEVERTLSSGIPTGLVQPLIEVLFSSFGKRVKVLKKKVGIDLAIKLAFSTIDGD